MPVEGFDPSTVKVGTSGYQFDDWFGTVYPARLNPRDVLEYYASALGMDTVEINYTYYRLPSAFTSEAMARKVPEGFEFAVRSFSGMTHEIWDEGKNIRDTSEVFRQFVEGIMPLREAGKLGPVLLQFPYSFWPNRQTYDYLRRCREMLEGFQVVVEFRNSAWMRPSAFALLKELGFGYCMVDEPQIKGLLPLVPRATGPTAYLRLHGRNPNWFRASKDERYDYFYSEQELDEILNKVKDVVKEAVKTYVYFNNCPRGQALQNALMFKKILGVLKSFNAAQSFALRGAGQKP